MIEHLPGQLDIEDAISKASFSAWLSIHAPVGPEHRNANGPVALGYYGALSERFVWVHPDDAEPYLVFSDTLRYRMDGERHPLDVTEPSPPILSEAQARCEHLR